MIPIFIKISHKSIILVKKFCLLSSIVEKSDSKSIQWIWIISNISSLLSTLNWILRFKSFYLNFLYLWYLIFNWYSVFLNFCINFLAISNSIFSIHLQFPFFTIESFCEPSRLLSSPLVVWFFSLNIFISFCSLLIYCWVSINIYANKPINIIFINI